MTHRYITTQSAVDALLPTLTEKAAWGFDCETTGLDPLTDEVTLVTLGRPEMQYVIDARKVCLEPLRPFFESRDHKKIGHNVKFDYKMMRGSKGIAVERVICTMLGDKILNNGRKFRGFSLEDLLEHHIEVKVDKSLQKSFIGHKGDFSAEQIAYAATDTAHMLPLAKALGEKIQADSLQHVWHLENEVTVAFGDMELTGCILDKEGWRRQIDANLARAELAKIELDKVARELQFQTDLFGNLTINYRSPEQCLELLKRLRVEIKQEDKDGNIIRLPVTDTSDGTLMQLLDYPVVRHMQDYRSYMTRVSSFGESFFAAIHPKTGKLHFEVDQLGTETGRPAKHSKSKWNPLNIPKEEEYRHCFRCPEGEVVETDDFSGCELRIWAELSGDKGLIEAFDRGIDVHCYVATKLFRVEVTKKNENAHLRIPVKSLNFGGHC